MPRFEPLSEDALATIEGGWERLGSEVGVRFDHPRAIELFQAAGQTVDGHGRCGSIPDSSQPRRHRRRRSFPCTPATRIETSRSAGTSMMFGAANGPPFVRVDGERRDGTMADVEQLLKLTR